MRLVLRDLVHMSAEYLDDLTEQVYDCTREYRPKDISRMPNCSEDECFQYVSGRLGVSIDVIECIIYDLNAEFMSLWRHE